MLQSTTLEKRYGDAHYNNRDKMRSTNRKRYGDEKYRNIEKVKATKLARYGSETYNNMQKQIETNRKRYGTDHPAQSEIVKSKTKEYFLEKFGATNPAKNEFVKQKIKESLSKIDKKKALEKRKATCEERFGVPFATQNAEILQKQKETFIKNYGKHRLQSYRYAYENAKFDSSWELAVWIWAKDLKKKIIREPKSFTFIFNGAEHTYTPDFEIDGKLVEVKGNQFFENNKMICPYNRSLDELFEAKYMCALKNNVLFWKQEDIKEAILYVDSKYGKNYLKQFKRRK